MVVCTPQLLQKSSIALSGSGFDTPAGRRPQFFFDTQGRGSPRFEDLVLIRVLEQTHTIELPMKTILGQISSTPFLIRPTVDNPTDAHWDAAELINEWFDGHFNSERESFDHWMKSTVRDLLSIDAGVTELVPEDSPKRYLKEMYARDGATFTKNPDKHGRLPKPSSLEDAPAAYYQFALPSAITSDYRSRRGVPSHSDLLTDLYEDISFRFAYAFYNPIPFSRDQIVWMEESPRTWSVYGRGRIQYVARLTEIILNQDLSNKKYFTTNEVPEGIVNLVESNNVEIERFREYWKEEVAGKTHKVPIINGKVQWIKFRETLRDLDFIQSQEWYNKLVWMCFGLTQNEVGDVGNVNRSTAEEQTLTVYRKTTLPLLELIAHNINTEIMPYLQAYQEIGGEVEFAWEITNPAVEELQRKRQLTDLNNGLTTPNRILLERGEEPVPWGDMPKPLMESVARAQPEWFLSDVLGVENAPDPSLFPSLGLAYEPKGDSKKKRSMCQHDHGLIKDADEALRNDESRDRPIQVETIKRLYDAINKYLIRELGKLIPDIQANWPDPPEEEKSVTTKALLVNFDVLLQNLVLAPTLLRLIAVGQEEAMDDGVTYHIEQLEGDIADVIDEEDMEPVLDIRIADEQALAILREEAAQHVTGTEEEIKDQIRGVLSTVAEGNGNVNDAVMAMESLIPTLSRERALLIARTEVLQASRVSSQVVAESTDLVGGKGWHSTIDGRERAWHGAMNKVVVPKDQPFVVPQLGAKGQPSDYPRETMVVGGDQPFNCRCDQRLVLTRDMPDDLKSITQRYPELKFVKLTPTMKLAHQKYARDGESFKQMLRRHREGYSGSRGAEELGIYKQAYYRWLRSFYLMS